jgi:hypothetical protein
MTTHTNPRDEFEAQTEANYATVAAWVEQMTGRFFTAERAPGLGGNVTVVRTDGEAIYTRDGANVTGMAGYVSVPSVRNLDRRHRTTMAEVAEIVGRATRALDMDDLDLKDRISASRFGWMARNKVR